VKVGSGEAWFGEAFATTRRRLLQRRTDRHGGLSRESQKLFRCKQ
jgi:hypothetical protein